eukprot:scaffold659171_cov57-Prasinocladus_malaysianus.AAC.1
MDHKNPSAKLWALMLFHALDHDCELTCLIGPAHGAGCYKQGGKEAASDAGKCPPRLAGRAFGN